MTMMRADNASPQLRLSLTDNLTTYRGYLVVVHPFSSLGNDMNISVNEDPHLKH